jgi:hypothetical protein
MVLSKKHNAILDKQFKQMQTDKLGQMGDIALQLTTDK